MPLEEFKDDVRYKTTDCIFLVTLGVGFVVHEISLSSKFVIIEIRGTPRSTRVYAGSRSCTGIAPRAWGILACAGCCCTPPGINSSSPAFGGARRSAPQLLLMLGGSAAAARACKDSPCVWGAMPVHEREPTYKRVEREAPRISMITNPNLDDNQIREDQLCACTAQAPVHASRTTPCTAPYQACLNVAVLGLGKSIYFFVRVRLRNQNRP